MTNNWQPFVGEYEKQFYEVLVADHVVKHCWPNAGRLVHTDGKPHAYGPANNVQFRRCTCGHQWGGCLPPEPERCKATVDMFGESP